MTLFKKAAAAVVSLLLSAVFLLAGCTSGGGESTGGQVVTSFYPIYIMTRNLTNGIDGITVSNMTQNRGGCLHDYQLLPGDMRMLSGAELFVINGAGLETFLDQVTSQLTQLTVCDSSAGAAILSGEGEAHRHGDDHDGHDHGDNAHIWLSVDNAMVQVRNISDALIRTFPQYREQLTQNTQDYLARLAALKAEIQQTLSPWQGAQVVSFHEGLDYLMDEFGLKIAHEVETHDGAQPSAQELAGVTSQIRQEGIRLLAIDADEPPVSAEVLARETGAVVCPLSTVVNGDGNVYDYENAMRANAQAIAEVLGS